MVSYLREIVGAFLSRFASGTSSSSLPFRLRLTLRVLRVANEYILNRDGAVEKETKGSRENLTKEDAVFAPEKEAPNNLEAERLNV